MADLQSHCKGRTTIRSTISENSSRTKSRTRVTVFSFFGNLNFQFRTNFAVSHRNTAPVSIKRQLVNRACIQVTTKIMKQACLCVSCLSGIERADYILADYIVLNSIGPRHSLEPRSKRICDFSLLIWVQPNDGNSRASFDRGRWFQSATSAVGMVPSSWVVKVNGAKALNTFLVILMRSHSLSLKACRHLNIQ